MFTCRRYMNAHEYNWNHSYINRLLFAVVLLSSIVEITADKVHLMRRGSSQEINCTIYRSCTQCADASTCSWLIEKQICFYKNQSQSENFTVDIKESCPEFTVTLKTDDKRYSIQVTVSNIAVKSVKTFFNESAIIGCEIENATYNASMDNGTITCNGVKEKMISHDELRTIELLKTNHLFVVYFSIVVNNIRIEFNDPRDHYINYRGWMCPSENCTIGFWESDSRKYYCKWCLKNDGCNIPADQQPSCDIRNAINNEKWNEDLTQSTIEVKSSNVAIESFRPEVLLFLRKAPTVVNITVKNHRFLADGRSMTVTVAGIDCKDPKTVDAQTVNCTIKPGNQVTEGLVVIVYKGKTSVMKLKSAKKFKFVKSIVTGISPMCGPAAGGTQLELTGEYLNATDNVQVFYRNITTKVMCKIISLAHDRIGCVTSANTDEHKSGPLQIAFDNMYSEFYKNKKRYLYVADPTVLDGQVFEGIASGDIPFTVLGGFDCTGNQQMYVDYNGKRYYGHCVLPNTNNATLMECWPPKLGGLVQMTSLPLGFRLDLPGKVVSLQQQKPYRYLLHPDPTYTDFEVQDGTVVRVYGVFPSPLQRPRLDGGGYLLEVTFLCDKVDDDDDDRCTVTNVAENYAECRLPPGTSVADILEIAVAVGKQVKRTVVHRRHKRYYAIVRVLRPQYVIGGISSLLLCVLTLILCVKKIMNSSKQRIDRRYFGELRNITAGIEDTTDYLIQTPAIR